MLSTVYTSKAIAHFTESDLESILSQSRANNGRLELSGMLLFREGRFLQVLEGPDAALRERMAIIRADPRHTEVNTLIEEETSSRFFGQWTMRYEPVTDDMVDDVPGYSATFDDLSASVTTENTVAALRDLIAWFQASPGQKA